MVTLNVLEMLIILVLAAGIGILMLLMGTQEQLLSEKRTNQELNKYVH